MTATHSFLHLIDSSWTLFLDRDGVINKRIPDAYVRNIAEFEFLPDTKAAFSIFRQLFSRILVVSNQQGIGKGIMTEEDLRLVHNHMLNELNHCIDNIYYAPHLASENNIMRKPNIGMALQAKKDFPSIDFSKSIMVGDSSSDMLFGKNAGMKIVLIADNDSNIEADMKFDSLYSFALMLKNSNN